MKKQEIRELFSKSIGELQEIVKKIRGEVAKLVIEREIGKLKNVALIGEKKKDIARILTIIREKEIKKL